MGTRTSFAGHPILEPIALGGFVLSFAFDLVGLATGAASPSMLSQLAYYTMIGSIVGALAAAVPGLAGLFAPPSDVEQTAIADTEITLLVVAIYAVNVWLRHSDPHNLHIPMVLSLAAMVLLLVSGWLGEKMAASTMAGHGHAGT
jgi:uncharacterized membrane protein